MRLPRDLSGRDVARALVRALESRIVHRRGSHIVMEKERPTHQRIAIPDHSIRRVGTLNAIIKSIASDKGVEKNVVISFLSLG